MNELRPQTLSAWLDAQADDFGHCEGCEVDCRCGHCPNAMDILAGVLELHQRLESGMGYREVTFDGYGEIKGVCAACGKSDEYAVPWPCPTIEVIARGLGLIE